MANLTAHSHRIHSFQELPSSSILIDELAVNRNLQRMADYAEKHQLKLRPHSKTHKSLHFAQLQLDSGNQCSGLTVAKVGEAEVMSGICDDLLIAYPTVDLLRCKRIAILAHRCNLKLAIDSSLAAENLSAAATTAGSNLELLVDVDVGTNRTGVQSISDAVLLGSQIEKLPNVRLAGILCYPGHLSAPVAEQKEPLLKIADYLQILIEEFDSAGLDRSMVSGGTTPTAFQSHLIKQLTEIRPGTYIFNDMNMLHGGFCKLEDCAARIICTVVSNTVAGQVVIDAGSKTLTSDRCGPKPESGYGYVVEFPQARIKALNEEHGMIDVKNCEKPPTLGQRITIIPNHICPCVNLQNHVYLAHQDGTFSSLSVDTRGMLL